MNRRDQFGHFQFALYYYELSDGEDTLQFSPSQFVDISAVETLKGAACYAHASQTPDRYYELQIRLRSSAECKVDSPGQRLSFRRHRIRTTYFKWQTSRLADVLTARGGPCEYVHHEYEFQ